MKTQLQALVLRIGISQKELGLRIGPIGPCATSLILRKGIWPATDPDQVREKLIKLFIENGIAAFEIHAALDEVSQPVVPGLSLDKAAISLTARDGVTTRTRIRKNEIIEEEVMLLSKQTLTQTAKKHFSLFSNPFTSDVREANELFLNPAFNYVRESLFQAAKHGGFIAISGESGSGKTTLRRDLLDRIQRENLPIIVIEPYIIATEDNDVKGKTLKSAHIAEAIIKAIAPYESVRAGSESRFRQLHNLLIESCRAGYSHVLIIEEAHSLPIPTLKHLKRFFELEDGYKKLLSIALIGQNELASKLSERNPAVREVVQRCEIVTLEPLTGTSLVDYLQHRLKNTNRKLDEFINEDGLSALGERLSQKTGTNRGQFSNSMLYPLAIGNVLTGALNMAAELGAPVISGDVVRSI